MKKFKKVFVVSNTHWDREFRMSLQKTTHLLVQMMDSLLELLQRQPDYGSFTMDGQVIPVIDYLDVRPEKRALVKKMVEQKRLFIGPWFSLPDMPNCGAEAILRNQLLGHRLCEELGGAMNVGYTPCSWGQTGQLPQILRGFGLDTALFYRGISPHEAPTEFLWEASDGSRVLAHRFSLFARYNYYYLVFRRLLYGFQPGDREWSWGAFGEPMFRVCDRYSTMPGYEILKSYKRFKKKDVVKAFREMLELEGESYVSPYFLAMMGHDISFANPLEVDIIREARRQQPEFEVVHSDLETYMTALKQVLDFKKLKVLKRERRGNLKTGYWTYLLPATISVRSYLKVMDFETEGVLVGQSEPMSVVKYLLGGDYPEGFLSQAWQFLLTNHTHDAHSGCASDEIIEDVVFRYRQAGQIGEELAEDALRFLAERVEPQDHNAQSTLLLVFNPLPWKRDDILEVEFEVPEEETSSPTISDEKGKKLDYQLVERGLHWRFVDNLVNVPHAYSGRKLRFKVALKGLPAVGWQTLQVAREQKPSRTQASMVPEPNTLENQWLRVKVNPNGTLTVEHKKTGETYEGLGYYVDQGEAGNAWSHEAPDLDLVINSLGSAAQMAVVEDGPLSATLRVDLELQVPACLQGKQRSEQLISLPITSFVSVKKGGRMVEIRTVVHNQARDHWLRVALPVQIKTDESLADMHFDLVRRPIAHPDCRDWKEPYPGTFPFINFVALRDKKRGLAFIGHGLKEYEVQDDKPKTLLVSLLRGVQIKLEVSEPRKQILPDEGAQCLGRQEFRYALAPFKPGEERELFRLAQEFNVPSRAAVFAPTREGTLPWEFSLFKQPPSTLVVSCLKKAARGEGIILRMFNPQEHKVEETIKFTLPVKEAYLTNLKEEKEQELPVVQKNAVSLIVAAKKIVTLWLVFDQKS